MGTQTLGERISQLRNNCGMTQKELGEKLNVSAQAVSKWENGLSEPDVDTIKNLCTIFGITVSELFDENAQPSAETAQSAAPTTTVIENTRIINGYCESCKKPVGPDEYIIRGGRGTQHIYCNECAKQMEAAAKVSEYYDHKKGTRRSLIFGPVAGIIALGVMLAALLVGDDPLPTTEAVIISIVFGLGYFAFISQMFWDSVVQDMFFFFLKSFKMPGVIFTLDLEGILFLIFVKLFLSFLSIFLSVIWFLIGVLLVLPITSIFIYPFALAKHVHEGKKLKTNAQNG